MTSYSVVLTDDQVLALEYEVEQENMRRAQMTPPGGMPPVPTTPEHLLSERVGMTLQSSYMQVQTTLKVVESMLDITTINPLTEERLHAVKISGAIKNYLRKKYVSTSPTA